MQAAEVAAKCFWHLPILTEPMFILNVKTI